MLKFCKRCNTEKHIDLFHNDKTTKDGKSYTCAACNTKQTVKRFKENKLWQKESYKVRNKKRMQTEHAKKLAVHASTKWQRENPNKSVPYNRANAAMKRVKQKYPDLIACTLVDILPIYVEAFKLEQQTGEKHHVDHNIPLVAGGLHSVENLKILSEQQHKQKSLLEFNLMRELMKKHFSGVMNETHNGKTLPVKTNKR